MYAEVEAAVEEVLPCGLPIVIGETGWPSDGNPNPEAVPSLENAQRYFCDVLAWSIAKNIPLFYFEAFDENWKEDGYANVEKHWGLWYADGSPKLSLDECPSTCGNAILEVGEECDDGNPLGGDGCETDCTLSMEDSDLDGIPDDGDGSGGIGDAPCAPGELLDCDDSCPNVRNVSQRDTDGNGVGDACQCGDVNCDGMTNVADALKIARGQLFSSDPDFGKCDVNGDALCNVADALAIARGEISSAHEAQLCPAYR